ncbi:MAG: UDP-glucose pyrophosphorylase [candidate division TM6 bacterium GW2011_GWF2_32_72]|nr:MAG: UDP-glucose pyrophosphorylase [candidate division TM6 bacterium GW2011_GWF2_32_72]
MEIIKAVIPAAGFGTRFLPYTKSIPKEMLPLLDRPAIQSIVEEGIASGIKNFIMVTNKDKESIINHFDSNPLLETFLREKNQQNLTEDLEKINRAADFTFVRQSEPLGLGHAILKAQHSIGKEHFAIMLPDDILISKIPGLSQLIRVARQEKASIIAVQEVPQECVSSYGIIKIKKQITPNLFKVAEIIEKPKQKDAPSNLAVVGRYVLSNKIFSSLEEIAPYAINELQLTDAITHMLKNNEKVFAFKIQGLRYDIGTPVGWLKATLGMALQSPEYGPYMRRFLADLDSPESFVYNKAKNIHHII